MVGESAFDLIGARFVGTPCNAKPTLPVNAQIASSAGTW